MTTGPNEFKLQINCKDIAEIVELSKQTRLEDQAYIRNAPYDDVHAAYYILGLIEFMKTRRVEPGFELVLSE